MLKGDNLLGMERREDFDGGRKAIIKTEELSSLELEKYLKVAWRRFYLRPRYMIRMLFIHLASFSDLKRLIGGIKTFVIRWR